MPQHWWVVDAEGEQQSAWLAGDPPVLREYVEPSFYVHRDLMATGDHLPLLARAADYYGEANYEPWESAELAEEIYWVMCHQAESYDPVIELVSLCGEAWVNARRGWCVVVRPD